MKFEGKRRPKSEALSSVVQEGENHPKPANRVCIVMSALGQKQTCAPQKAMSALPPIATAKADISDVLHQMIWTNQGHFAGFIWYSIFSKDRS
jgi:hypothetical protein